MNENQTLELKIKSTSQEATNSMDKLLNKMTGIEDVLINTYLELGRIEKKSNETKKSFEKLASTTKKSFEDISNVNLNKLTKKLDSLFSFATAKRLGTTFISWMNEAVDQTEQLNLFNVVFNNIEKDGVKTFSELGKEATKFQYKLNEAFGTNKTETLYMQGIFQSMGETVGIADKYSAIMSETMTKLTYDLASLYNKSETNTAEAIRAGVYAGQTKPLRAYGIDVTQTSMQPILDSLGITDRTIKDMSQAEKEILRYLATLKQAKIAMGDLANTIESPSNQMKIFRQQLVETKVAISSLFMGAFQKILPYANAFLMVIKECAKAIADMFGIKLTDYNSGIASQEDAYVDLGDSVDDAIGKVKELKKQTLGFDEIHNIDTPKNNNSGVSEITGGIDQRLLDAISGYDNGMDKVRMKATEIRDRIMEWLGFTKKIDPLTGEIGFKLKDGETRFGNILKLFKTIKDVLLFALNHAKEIIGAIIGYKILKGITNVYNVLKNVKEIWGKIGMLPKAVLTIAVVAEGAELISKTDDYANYVKSVVGDDYDGPTDLFGMWGQIFKTAGEADKINADNVNGDYELLLHQLAGIDYAKKNGLDSSIMENLFENQKNDIKRKYGIKDMEKLLENYSQYSTDYMNKFFGESFFNNNDAFNIKAYTDQIGYFFNTISDGYGILDGYKEKIQNNNEAYSNASIQLGNLISNLNNPNYKTTAEDIEKINELFKQMGEISNDTANENYLAVVKIVGNLNKHGYASDELTQKIMDNAYKQKLAEEGKTQAQIDKLLELDKQLKNNIITEQEYKQKIFELTKEFSENNNIVGKAIISFDNLSKNVDITAGSYEEMQTTVENFASIHESATEKIKDETKGYIELMEQQQARCDRTTEEGEKAYQEYAEAIAGLRQQEKDDLKKLDDQYAISMENILRSLVNSKEHGSKEITKMEELINEELKKIGKGVDLSKNVDDINKQLDGIKDKTITIDADDTKLNNKIPSIKNALSLAFDNIFGPIGSFLGFKANGGVYSGGSWHDIPQYANGGIPSHGSLVFAGENGPEIMGNVNGKTEILNKSQIASSIYSAVASAMSEYGNNQSNEIDVHLHTDEGIVVDRINQRTKQTGVCPINIPMTY